jgi:predicted MFS family arabinose efflux permease
LLAFAVVFPWALGGFATNSAQQARLVGLAPALASGSVSLNTSAMYAGQAIGAALGGVLISAGHMNDLHWYGLAGLLLALVASHWATHLAGKVSPVRADQTY